MAKPDFANAPDMKAVYGWLKTNGVDEWVPENPTITVDETAGTITYTAFIWEGARGWDGGNIGGDPNRHAEQRTVPLIQAPDARIIAAAGRAGATLTVVGQPAGARALPFVAPPA